MLRKFSLAHLAAVVGVASAGLLIGIPSAQAACGSGCTFNATQGDSVGHSTYTGKKSEGWITQAGSWGLQSQALCQRANGGTALYTSTIRVSTVGSGSSNYSHYDCANNGTYDVALDQTYLAWTAN